MKILVLAAAVLFASLVGVSGVDLLNEAGAATSVVSSKVVMDDNGNLFPPCTMANHLQELVFTVNAGGQSRTTRYFCWGPDNAWIST